MALTGPALQAYAAKHKARFEEQLKGLVEIPSVSADPDRKATWSAAPSPFAFTKQGDTYFGRGTTDDKGPALSALYGARAALDAGVPINVKVLWELEEEVGSPQARPASGCRPRA